ncbi:MAG: nitrous oxide reductase accessory protein NosL [Nitrospirae bacterium]|nr:nitrous oxide reductase accessory protein NosL [Nitrospirota bacterium]
MNSSHNVVLSLVCCLTFTLVAAAAPAGDLRPAEVKKDDRCAVCGMFVAKYRTWIAQIVFSDGSYAAFDGPKDMFKYYLQPGKYAAAKKPSDITAVYVTEYYSAKLMDAKKMFYVAGSNVLGPMGDELIPVASEEKAREFMKDHKGKEILTFPQITMDHLLRSHAQ